MLVEFDQHATGLHVFDDTVSLPNSGVISVDDTCAALVVPPSTFPPCGRSAVDTSEVVVVVCSRKQHSIDDVLCIVMSHKSIAGVSAVPVHRQLILTNLITDGERRVFSPVP